MALFDTLTNNIDLTISGSMSSSIIAPALASPITAQSVRHGFQTCIDNDTVLEEMWFRNNHVLFTTTSHGFLLSDINNYNPEGFNRCRYLRVASNGTNRTITGMVPAGNYFHERTFINTASSGGLSVLFANQHVGSAVANRFSLPGAATLTLAPQCAVTFLYDSSTSRWRVLSIANF